MKFIPCAPGGGPSLLKATGLTEWIADTPGACRQRILAFCREKTGGLRETSEVFDGAAFARKLEALLADVAENKGFLSAPGHAPDRKWSVRPARKNPREAGKDTRAPSALLAMTMGLS